MSNQRYDWKTEKEYELMSKTQEESRVQCKHCGRKVLIPASMDYKICSWCHHKVKNDTRNHFVVKMRKLLTKEDTR